MEGVVDLSPEDVVVLGEGDQAELECKVGLKITKIIMVTIYRKESVTYSYQVSPAYPRPSLSWSGDREVFGLLDTSGQVCLHIKS